MKKNIFLLIGLFHSALSVAQPSLSFGIVAQQSTSELARLWTPIIQDISQKSGIAMHVNYSKP